MVEFFDCTIEDLKFEIVEVKKILNELIEKNKVECFLDQNTCFLTHLILEKSKFLDLLNSFMVYKEYELTKRQRRRKKKLKLKKQNNKKLEFKKCET